MHYFGGEILTYEQIQAKGDPGLSILPSNMKGNGWTHCFCKGGGHPYYQPFLNGDALVSE